MFQWSWCDSAAELVSVLHIDRVEGFLHVLAHCIFHLRLGHDAKGCAPCLTRSCKREKIERFSQVNDDWYQRVSQLGMACSQKLIRAPKLLVSVSENCFASNTMNVSKIEAAFAIFPVKMATRNARVKMHCVTLLTHLALKHQKRKWPDINHKHHSCDSVVTALL